MGHPWASRMITSLWLWTMCRWRWSTHYLALWYNDNHRKAKIKLGWNYNTFNQSKSILWDKFWLWEGTLMICYGQQSVFQGRQIAPNPPCKQTVIGAFWWQCLFFSQLNVEVETSHTPGKWNCFFHLWKLTLGSKLL